MKLFSAALVTESSDLAPIGTTEEQWCISRHSDKSAERESFSRTILNRFRQLANENGWDVEESICATSLPGGRTIQSVYESLRSTILDDLKNAMPVDTVLLSLHGAMMAHGYDDCEGDLLQHIRAITGPDVPIGVELDPHCHVSEKMMQHATAMILYKTMNHTDYEERATELFNLISSTLAGKVKPVMALFDCRMMNCTGFDETVEPMKSFYEKICAVERTQGILSISPVHCFPLADIPEMGSRMLVITDNNPGLAEQTAEALGMEFFGIGKQLSPSALDVELDKAQLEVSNGIKPIRLVELSDCSGCGFATDGTEFLEAMLKRDMSSMVAGFIWDPLAVSICLNVGINCQLTMRIGGKVSVLSGSPLDLTVTVEGVYPQATIIGLWGTPYCCDVAVIRSGDTQLILTSTRIFGTSESDFRQFGVEPNNKDYVLLKTSASTNSWRYVYGSALDHQNWPFTRIARPKWPWDKDPFDQQKSLCSGNPAVMKEPL